MRRGQPHSYLGSTGGGGGAHLSSSAAVGSVSVGSGGGNRYRMCMSALFVLVVMAIVVTVPPMKAKPYLATENTGVEDIQRMLHVHQRQQVLDGDDDERPNEVAGAAAAAVGGDASRKSLHAAALDHVAGGGGSGSSASLNSRRKIDLTLYIVFHKVLHTEHYEGLDWSEISYPNGAPSSSSPTTLDTASVVTALLSPEGANRTTIVFVATNRNVRKSYDADLVRGRLIHEWELPGYDTRIGSVMNEFGAMNSIFSSQLTQHAGSIANVAGRGTSPRLIAADADGDGVQEWIGVLQYDMHIDRKLIRGIRRRIVARTAMAYKSIRMGGILGRELLPISRDHSLQQHPQQQQHPLLPSHLRSQDWISGGHSAGRYFGRLHCCIFYGLSYPTKYLLHNPLGRALLAEYNTFFMSSFTLADLPDVSILDAFVVPSIVFNHIMPFLETVMLRVIRNPSAYPQVNRLQKPAQRPTTASPPQRGVEGNDALTKNDGHQQEPDADTKGSPLSQVRRNATEARGGDNSKNRSATTTSSTTAASAVSGGVPTAASALFGGGGAASATAHGLDVMEAALALSLGLETSFVMVQLPLRHKVRGE